jgi:hypothetical protein
MHRASRNAQLARMMADYYTPYLIGTTDVEGVVRTSRHPTHMVSIDNRPDSIHLLTKTWLWALYPQPISAAC